MEVLLNNQANLQAAMQAPGPTSTMTGPGNPSKLETAARTPAAVANVERMRKIYQNQRIKK